METYRGNLKISRCGAVYNYENIEKIVGGLLITDFSGKDLTSLKLYNLKEVTGEISIRDTAIENFKGLESLKIVGNHLAMYKIHNLKNFEGLNSLKKIGSMYIQGCQNLESFKGLDNLESMDTNSLVLIEDCKNLTLNGLPDNFRFRTLSIYGKIKDLDFTDTKIEFDRISIQSDAMIIAPKHIAKKVATLTPVIIPRSDELYYQDIYGISQTAYHLPYKKTKNYWLYKIQGVIFARKGNIISDKDAAYNYRGSGMDKSMRIKERAAIDSLQDRILKRVIKGD